MAGFALWLSQCVSGLFTGLFERFCGSILGGSARLSGVRVGVSGAHWHLQGRTERLDGLAATTISWTIRASGRSRRRSGRCRAVAEAQDGGSGLYGASGRSSLGARLGRSWTVTQESRHRRVRVFVGAAPQRQCGVCVAGVSIWGVNFSRYYERKSTCSRTANVVHGEE